jgi:hypothetical protein
MIRMYFVTCNRLTAAVGVGFGSDLLKLCVSERLWGFVVAIGCTGVIVMYNTN